MPLTTPRAGELRAKVTFQRRGSGANDGGYVETDWADLATRRAKLVPTRGGEAIIAGRLAGEAGYDLWVRSDSLTRTITPEDRVIDARDPTRIFNIRFAGDMDDKRTWLLFQVQAGVST